MKKKLRQVTGTSIGFTFDKEERDIYKMEVGQVWDLSDMTLTEDNLKDCIARKSNEKRAKEIRRRIKR